MALLLAPYNEAMRIGMGFNSYTQQLCVNDIVRKKHGQRASEKDLRPVDPAGEADGRKPVTSGDSDMLMKSSGSEIRKGADGGQNSVSQMVKWQAGFVDNMSDVTKNLNISGALSITVDGIGGAKAHGAYVNNTTFAKSDAKFNITVDVTNQKLIADDVTEFTPIPNVPANKFGEVYGDCFISGFIEGGVLSAMVMKTLDSKVDLTDMSGGLKVDINVSVAKVSGEAQGGKKEEEKTKKETTEINLSWSGGGDIKPDTVSTWDIESMMKVAMEFPDKVALCPQRTYAILTKYQNLRSFHEQTVKGSPLDYEIAGIYTSALLDAYVEYKAMWADILITLKEIGKGTSLVKRRNGTDQLTHYGEKVKKDYDSRMERYNAAKTALAKSPRNDITLEEPLPPNLITPYEADTLGMEGAQTDCRFEMIKIVREVNAVAQDPKVATDPYRNYQYISPNVFRLLLPTDKVALPTWEEIDQMKKDLEASIAKCAVQEREILATKTENSSLKSNLEESQSGQAKSAEEIQKQNESRAAADAEANAARDAKEKGLEAQLADLKVRYENERKEHMDKINRVEVELENTKRGKDEQNSQLRSEIDAANRERDAVRSEFSQGQDIEIYNITYGNRQFLGTGIENKVRQYITNNWTFSFDNNNFETDPMPGQRKQGSISYSRRNQRVKTFSAWEGDQFTFS